MKYLFSMLLCLFLALTWNAYAQYEQVWAFGTKAGLDFRSGGPVPFQTSMGVYTGASYGAFGEGCASVCDENGNLLFYSEGFFVWDKNGNVMPNGRNLIPTYGLNMPNTPSSSTSQGAVIVPIPEREGKYYLFSLTAKEYWLQRASDLYYSIIDMSLNGGLGDVVSYEKGILVDSFLTEKMTTTRGNRCNIWLLACGVDAANAGFKAYEITASGLNPDAVVSGTGLGSIISPFGTLTVSTNGRKILSTQGSNWGGRQGAALFDFDPDAGVITNKVQLLDCCGGYGTAFSPDGSKAYVSTYNNTIYQYNLNSNDPATIVASELRIGTANFSHLKQGPDGKIYFVSLRRNQLGVISSPDSAGLACGYTDGAITLSAEQKVHAGFPNTVTVVPYRATSSRRHIEADCWANVNPAVLSAAAVNGWDYLWSDSLTGYQRKAGKTGTYWVRYRTAPCISHTDTFYVAFPYGVLPDIGVRGSCNGANNGMAWAGTYPEDTVTYYYVWKDSRGDTLSLSDTLRNVPSGTYAVHIRTLYCDTTLYVVLPEQEFKVSFLSDSIVCQGSKLGFKNTSDEIYTQFQWHFGDGNASFLREPEYTFGRPGQYRVTLRATEGLCRDTFSRTITVDSIFGGKFVMQPDSICRGESISFLPQADSSILYLSWYFGDGITLFSQNVPVLQHAFDIPGYLPVTLTIQSRACPDTAYTDNVYVADLPEVYLGPDTILCPGSKALTLKNRFRPPGRRYHYLWNTGDTTETLDALYPGQYSLNLKAELLGCSNTAMVKVDKSCYLNIPNVFSPNDDGVNDYFFPRPLMGKSIERFVLQIRNRYGQIVFRTEEREGKGWNGKFNGTLQPVGTYVYLIDVVFDGDIAERYSGNVTLLK